VRTCKRSSAGVSPARVVVIAQLGRGLAGEGGRDHPGYPSGREACRDLDLHLLLGPRVLRVHLGRDVAGRIETLGGQCAEQRCFCSEIDTDGGPLPLDHPGKIVLIEVSQHLVQVGQTGGCGHRNEVVAPEPSDVSFHAAFLVGLHTGRQ